MTFRFDASEYGEGRRGDKKAKTYEPLPRGWYTAAIKDVTTKDWDDPPGKSIQVVWRVTKGPHEGRLQWQTLNVEHKDPTREMKARYMLADICNAVGVASFDRPADLIGGQCEVEVVVLSPRPPQYPEAKNWVSAVRFPRDEAMAVAAEQQAVEKSRADFDDDDIPF